MMKDLPFNPVFFLFLFLFCGHLTAQKQEIGAPETHSESCDHAAHQEINSQQLSFIENRGQWDADINYAIELGGLNYLYLEDQSFTYVFHDTETAGELHEVMKSSDEERRQHQVKGHAYRVHFLGALADAQLAGKNRRSANNNYILGNDPSKWAPNVPVYREVNYTALYPGVDLVTYGQGGNFKYDFVVAPSYEPSQIQLHYEGADSVYLSAGDLVVKTSINTIVELAPYAYQIVNGREEKIACHYTLAENVLTFSFPQGYNSTLPLIIDPTVIGATLSGTVSSENFGHSATFDNEGNIYTAAISFGQGYPATMGAFEINYAGGITDIAVNKFNQNGTNLIYATYIGGSMQEYPHSTIVDDNGQLCIFGSSASNNYPTTNTAIQSTFGGGQYDIVVTKLSADGSTLAGSTFLGGSQTDGFNVNTANEGDNFRGEIVLDAQGDIYIASCSRSPNFPVTANAFQTQLNGLAGGLDQDGIVAKLNSDLSTLFWATYLGGAGNDTAMGLRVAENGSVYITGIANSFTFPMTAGGVQPTFPGGTESAYVLQLSSTGANLISGTFWGSSGRDRGYFIDLDEMEQVHIYGKTDGTMLITPNTYSFNPGSQQFLAAFNPGLNSLVYSTVIGNGSNVSSFIPVAFMVDKCNNIYFSGYRTANGLPLSPDAFYTIGDSFYLGVLDPNATGLSFGTYYGRANHVDGGTSRFDKGGIVYQGVCSCTGMNRVLNTTPGAWSTVQDERCDVGVFKIDFEVATVTAQARTEPATSGCAPFATDFTYTGQDAETIFWDFGNGTTSTAFNPSTIYTEPGTYTVTQIVNAGNTCNLSDTFRLTIDVLDSGSTLQSTTICPGEQDIFLDVTTINATYQWSNGQTGPTIQTNEPGIYWVDINLTGCSRRDSFIVEPPNLNGFDLDEDLAFCDETSYLIDATNAVFSSYQWQDGSTGSTFTAEETGNYTVNLLTLEGCEVIESIFIRLDTTPFLELGPDQTACEGDIITVSVNDPNQQQVWQDGSTSTTYDITENGTYAVTVDPDRCPATDSINVTFFDSPNVDFNVTDVVCFGDGNGSITSAVTDGNFNLTYTWENGSDTTALFNLAPGDYPITITNQFNCTLESIITVGTNTPVTYEPTLRNILCHGDGDGQLSIELTGGGIPPYLFGLTNSVLTENTSIEGLSGGTYEVMIQDANGCTILDTFELYEPEEIFIEAGPDQLIELGESTVINGQLSSTQNQRWSWSPTDSLLFPEALRTSAYPVFTTVYTLTTIDTISGCARQDSLTIRLQKSRNVFIPNAFSPNTDGNNDQFQFFTDRSVARIRFLRIFTRWGEMVYEAENFLPTDPRFSWDGNHRNKPLNPQVLVYVAEVEFIDGVIKSYKGDLTLLR